MTDWNAMPEVGAGRCVCGAPAFCAGVIQGVVLRVCVKTGRRADYKHQRREGVRQSPVVTSQRALSYVRHAYREALQRQQQEPQP